MQYQPSLPLIRSKLIVWLFLSTEIMFFAPLFFAYALYRSEYAAAFAEASHHQNWKLGLTNTVVLIFSSAPLTVAAVLPSIVITSAAMTLPATTW